MDRFKKLNWQTPRRYPPHGYSGILTTFLGVYLTIKAMFFGQLNDTPTLLVFTVALIANARSGSKIAIGEKAKPFKYIARFQFSMGWNCIRFTEPIIALLSLGPTQLLPLLDFSAALNFILVQISLLNLVSKMKNSDAAVRSLISIGIALASTFVSYPLQLSYRSSSSSSYLSDFFAQYPDQGPAMSSYVYVPTATLISLIMFAATLFDRRIIGERGILLCAASIPVTLVANLLAQDIFFPTSSTQQLILGEEEFMNPTPAIHKLRLKLFGTSIADMNPSNK